LKKPIYPMAKNILVYLHEKESLMHTKRAATG